MPEIETQPLRLQQLVPDDLDAHHRSIYADAEVMPFMPGGLEQCPYLCHRSYDRMFGVSATARRICFQANASSIPIPGDLLPRDQTT
jgi:hypothetical protein